MDTIVSRNLYADPDFALLAREMKDPLRAAGALLFLWQGTQQKRLVEATEAEIVACFPLGFRGVKSVIAAMVKTGWLRDISELSGRYPGDKGGDIPQLTQGYPETGKPDIPKQPQRYEVRGNLKHVAKKAELSEQNRRAAIARWEAAGDAKRMRSASATHARASENDAQPMPPTIPSHSIPSQGGGSHPHPPPVETMADARALLIGTEARLELFEHWQSEHHRVWKSDKVLVPPTAALEAAGKVLVHAGGDMAVAKRAVTVLVETREGFWAKQKNALWLLTDARDFERARLSTGAKEKPRVDDIFG